MVWVKKYPEDIPVNFWDPNSANHVLPVFELMSCSTRGRLVTIPLPRGRKSLKHTTYMNTHGRSMHRFFFRFLNLAQFKGIQMILFPDNSPSVIFQTQTILILSFSKTRQFSFHHFSNPDNSPPVIFQTQTIPSCHNSDLDNPPHVYNIVLDTLWHFSTTCTWLEVKAQETRAGTIRSAADTIHIRYDTHAHDLRFQN